MNNYQKGRNFEYYVKKKLEKQGYFVIRSAGSHSPIDLIAIKPKSEILLIQCKLRKPTRKTIEKYKRLKEELGLNHLPFLFFYKQNHKLEVLKIEED